MPVQPGARLLAIIAAGLLLAGAPATAGGRGLDIDRLLDQFTRGGARHLARRALERELPRRVGPAARYDVRLHGENADVHRGRARRVEITGTDVRTDDGLVIPRLDLRLDDVDLDPFRGGLRDVGRSRFSAFLGAEAVSQYVRRRAGVEVRDLGVRFRSGEIRVQASPVLAGLSLPSEVRGKPELAGRNQVNFRASRVSVFGLGLPGFAVDALERKVNPVVDLSGLRLPVRITDLTVREDRLVASGAAEFDLPGRR